MISEVVTPALWGCWALTSFVVAFAGPFGTFGTRPFFWRLLYWSVLIALAIWIAIGLRAIWRTVLKQSSELTEDVIVSVSLAVVFGPLVIAINMFVGGPEAREAMGLWAVMACTFAIAVGTIAMRRVLSKPSHVPVPVVSRDRLLSRIDAPEGARISRISSDNHHIRIHLSTGEEHRVLMRLRDALEEMDVETGVIVHRSHWVAKDDVVGVTKEGNRIFVMLCCGAKVPVGPSYRENLSFAVQLSDQGTPEQERAGHARL